MSLPLIAMAGLAAAGTGLQMGASEMERSKMNDVTGAEMQRQRALQDQASAEFAKSLGQSGPDTAQKQIDTGAATREAAMTKQAAIPLTASQTSSPVATQSADVVSPQLAQSASARARLSGYTDWDLQQWIKNLRAQQQLGMISNFARGSANVLPYELQDASKSAEWMRMLGQGVSLGGMGAGALGAFGSLGGAGASAAAPAAVGSFANLQSMAMFPGWGYGQHTIPISGY